MRFETAYLPGSMPDLHNVTVAGRESKKRERYGE
jgi:hypothetical protein